MKESLHSQVALVTGASSGIGKAIATALTRAGASLCLVGRNVAVLQQMAAALPAGNGFVRYYPADLADPVAISALRDRLQNELDRVDILVHSAGVISLGTFEAPGTDLDRHYQVNVRAPFVLTQALLEKLRAAKGQVVFLNSTAGLRSRAGLAHYAASKHALKALADSLRDEINPAGVRVLSIFLGRTATSMQAEVTRQEGVEYYPERLIQPEDVADVVVDALMLPRTAEITEIHMRPMAKTYRET